MFVLRYIHCISNQKILVQLCKILCIMLKCIFEFVFFPLLLDVYVLCPRLEYLKKIGAFGCILKMLN